MPLTAAEKKELYIKIFTEELKRELQFLSDVISGRAQRRPEFTDKLFKIILPGVEGIAGKINGVAGVGAKIASVGIGLLRDHHVEKRIGFMDSSFVQVDLIALKILAEQVAREIVRRYEFFITMRLADDVQTGITPLVRCGVRRSLEYLARNKLEITKDNLLDAIFEGNSGAGVDAFTNTSLEGRKPYHKAQLTAEDVYRRSAFLASDGSYWFCIDPGAGVCLINHGVAIAKRDEHFEKYGFVLLPPSSNPANMRNFSRYCPSDELLQKIMGGYKKEIVLINDNRALLSTYLPQLARPHSIRRLIDFVKTDPCHESSASLMSNITRVILRGDLSAFNLHGADLSNVDLSDTIISGDLRGVNFHDAYLVDAEFRGVMHMDEATNFAGAHCEYLKAERVNFNGVDLTQANFSFAHLLDSSMQGCKTLGVNWYKTSDLDKISGCVSVDSRNELIRTLIKRRYVEFLAIDRVMGDDPLPLYNGFINLTLVNDKDSRERERLVLRDGLGAAANENDQDSMLKDERIGSFESLYAEQESLELGKLFVRTEHDTEDPNKILLLGRAGIGKTILCRYLASEWAYGRKWQEFSAIFFVPLRELINSADDVLSTAAVIRQYCLGGDPAQRPTVDAINAFLVANQNQCLWVLDGYDEVAQLVNEPTHQHKWRGFMEGVFSYQHVLLTSRPNVNINTIAGLSLHFNRRLENMGFTNDNIEAYVKKIILQPAVAESKLQFLRANPSIWGIAHVPINLDLLCSTEINGDTMTKLYGQLVDKLLERYEKRPRDPARPILMDRALIIQVLGALAYAGIRTGQILLDPAMQETCLCRHMFPRHLTQSILEELLNVGLIKQTADKAIYFIHLTFQEYLAADYLVQKSISTDRRELADFILHEKYNPRCEVVMWFIAGLLYRHKQIHGRGAPLRDFFDMIQVQPRDLVGMHHAALLIRCLDECDGGENIKPMYGELVGEIMPWIEMWGRCDFTNEVPMFRALKISAKFSCTELMSNFWLDIMRNYEDRKYSALKAMQGINISPTQEMISVLLAELSSDNEDVSSAAAKLLGKLGQRNVNEAILVLLQALNDSNNDDLRRARAAEALGKLGNHPETVIVALLNALECKDSWKIRSAAAEALGKLGQVNNLDVIILALLRTLNSYEAYGVRSSAVVALGKLGTASDIDIIPALLLALKDKLSWNVRVCAAEALAKLGQGNHTKEIICTLLDTVGDKRFSDDSYSAFTIVKFVTKALVKLGQENLAEVIPVLLQASCSQNSDICKCAVGVLSELGQGKYTGEIITCLRSIVLDPYNNNDIDIRLNAAEVIVKLGQENLVKDIPILLQDFGFDGLAIDTKMSIKKTLTDLKQGNYVDVMSALRQALGEGNSCKTRTYAVRILGKIGRAHPSSTIISILQRVLKNDEDGEVRACAAIALEKLGQGNYPDVILSLLRLLYFEYSGNIRIKAVEALIKLVQGNYDAVILALQQYIGGSDFGVRVTNTLVKLKQGNYTEVISVLLSVLGDSDMDASSNAMEALIKRGQENNPEVILSLLQALAKLDCVSRASVAEVLGNITRGKSQANIQATPEQLQTMLTAARTLNLPITVYEHYLGVVGVRLGLRVLPPSTQSVSSISAASTFFSVAPSSSAMTSTSLSTTIMTPKI